MLLTKAIKIEIFFLINGRTNFTFIGSVNFTNFYTFFASKCLTLSNQINNVKIANPFTRVDIY